MPSQMPSLYLPLRWESTGDQWWYASPIDWAAANGHYDLVWELLRLDSNLLIKLTSLRRIRRFETVWDDEAQFNNVAKCRCQVAEKLFRESETKQGDNSLIQTGYGGWLLYTAASAGDVSFAKELLQRDPLLVFGEGEYGVTDIFYAASRSKNTQVFRLLFDFSTSSSCPMSSSGKQEWHSGDTLTSFKWEMMNRAVHAAARGGNLEILKELLQGCTDVSVYRDVHGSTILHSASGRGQTEVVKDLVASFDIINSVDNRGNTALHVAAFHGHVAVVEALILSSPSLVHLRNHSGDTFLHMAVAGFQSPGFRRLDQHIELIKHLVSGECGNTQDIINARNDEGRTALHTAVIGNVHSDLVEILMSVPFIDINIHDAEGMTPLDILGQQPQSLSSEILIKHLISGGGLTNCLDYKARSTIVSHLKMQQGTGLGSSSPGTSFQIPDARIFSCYTGAETSGGSARVSSRSSASFSCSSNSNSSKKHSGSVSNARRHLKSLLRWSRHMSKMSEGILVKVGEEEEAVDENKKQSEVKEESMNDTITSRSSLSSVSSSSAVSLNNKQNVAMHETAGASCSNDSTTTTIDMTPKSASTSKRLMDQYFCFGKQDIVAESQPRRSQQNQNHGYKFSVASVA